MPREAKIFVAGAAGMVGSAIIRKLIDLGYTNIISSYHHKKPGASLYTMDPEEHTMPDGVILHPVDLASQAQVKKFFNEVKPKFVFMAAARVGGMYANNTYPASFIYENLTIQGNVIHAAYEARVERLLFLGSSCIYPRLSPQPMTEEHLLTGLLEPTNKPYAIAKIAGIKMCEAYNRQYNTRFIALTPTNLYGPNDNFDLENSHVVPALMRKLHDAKMSGRKAVVIWGSGSPRREFLHVDDVAKAAVFVMNLNDKTVADEFLSYPRPCFVNVGSGIECTIWELTAKIRKAVNYEGEIVFDSSRLDGAPKKLLDDSRLAGLGWRHSIGLDQGIEQTYGWYLGTREE